MQRSADDSSHPSPDAAKPHAGSALLRCPTCDHPLTFIYSIVGGVEPPPEYWDRFECEPCHAWFDYRRRTRVLRQLAHKS